MFMEGMDESAPPPEQVYYFKDSESNHPESSVGKMSDVLAASPIATV